MTDKEKIGAAKHEKREALRAALIAGENSGLSMPFDFEEFIAAKRAASNGS